MVKLLVLVAALGVALTPATAMAAEAGGSTLTVPPNVQQVQGQPASPVPATFSYPGVLGVCGTRVSFTWDGGAWATAEPTVTGLTSCEASVSAVPPAGTPAGRHQVCASSGVSGGCDSLTLVIKGPAPPSPQPRPAATASPTASPSTSPGAGAAPSPSPSLPVLVVEGPPAGEEMPGRTLELSSPRPAEANQRASGAPSSTGMLIALGVLLAALAGTVLSLRSLFGADKSLRG